MNTNIVFSAIILVILISFQYTLNLILRELRDIRRRMIKNTNDFED